MLTRKDFPILIVDADLRSESARGRAVREVIAELEELGFIVIQALSPEDGRAVFYSHPEIGSILLQWELGTDVKGDPDNRVDVVRRIRMANPRLPIFIISEMRSVREIPVEVVREISGYIWLLEDTPEFVAGRIKMAADAHLREMLPPFFGELAKYVAEFKYTWHTPGHGGGVAFQKTAAGRAFFNFLGENTLRGDLSVSVPELGSLLEHSGVVGEAERAAAEVFGSDMTFFVTNGTSTANKIVWHGCVTPGDVVLVDRNCHKSIMHAIIMTGAVPVYLIPTRNPYGIIGPIHQYEFNSDTIRSKIQVNPLIEDKGARPKLAVVTNSTYDGLCYNARMIQEKLKGVVDFIHFDEAWYGYARFHELYEGRFGMTRGQDEGSYPVVFSTQSTHKVLAALSQGSMIHVKNGRLTVDFDRFNEAFMMHTSTSPQYGIIASLDVASSMMSGDSGKLLLKDVMDEADVFRLKSEQTYAEMMAAEGPTWFFKVWEPDRLHYLAASEEPDSSIVCRHRECWTLANNEGWHGFGDGFGDDYVMLDPTKVTVLTPGISGEAMSEWGIPAAVVSRFLWSRGVVVEKTGHYSFLVLFTIGITRGKSGTLLSEFFDFKKRYDQNERLATVFPDLVEAHPGKYEGWGLKDLSDSMHAFLREAEIPSVIRDAYSTIPEPEVIPAEAYRKVVTGDIEKVGVRELMGRSPATMVVPYPPGIPIIMPGEKFTEEAAGTMKYLEICEDFDNRFPGFENEVHGIQVEADSDGVRYTLYCLT